MLPLQNTHICADEQFYRIGFSNKKFSNFALKHSLVVSSKPLKRSIQLERLFRERKKPQQPTRWEEGAVFVLKLELRVTNKCKSNNGYICVQFRGDAHALWQQRLCPSCTTSIKLDRSVYKEQPPPQPPTPTTEV